jgi:murein DD-endopeptidase MepM/ murein hydrolase activator NlpD
MLRTPKNLRAKAQRIANSAIAMLLTLGFGVQPGLAAGGGLGAKITTSGDGMAQVTFSPMGGDDMVTVYNRSGVPLARLNWAASFRVAVTEDALRRATTIKGIDIHSLLQDVGTVSAGKQLLVAAELPATNEPVRDSYGRVLPPGTEVFFELERLAKEGVAAPTNAYGGQSMGPGGAANEFNDRLLRSGVKDAKKTRSQIAIEKAEAIARREPVHGPSSPNVPMESAGDTSVVQDSHPNAFLSAPTCTTSSNSMFMKSFWGKRKPFKTKNGKWATSWHDGVDIAGRAGTPILAAADGCMTVNDISFNRGPGYGLTIKLDHKNGLVSQYSHMQNFTAEIVKWQRRARKGEEYCVKRGDRIGSIGSTGNVTGPHLHFGLKRDGKSVNPLAYSRATTNAEFSNSCDDVAKNNAALRAAEAETQADLARPDSSYVGSASPAASGSEVRQ